MSDDPNAEFTIKVRMHRDAVPGFLGMLKQMQRLGSIGASRTLTFAADGDGHFNPQFDWDSDIEPTESEETRLLGSDQYGYHYGSG